MSGTTGVITGDCGYAVHLGAETITSDNVVVATGTRRRTPHVPEFAGELAPTIQQLHSTQYQRPSQLIDGPTLVVGASHSGCEIAYEIAEHLPVTLCGRYTGNEPFTPGSGRDRIFTQFMVQVANHVLTRRTPPGRKVMRYVRGVPVRVQLDGAAGCRTRRSARRRQDRRTQPRAAPGCRVTL